MVITVERDVCVGAGQCALVAPDLFDQDDDGIVVLLEANPDESMHDGAVKAARLCPARAITVSTP